MEPVQLIDVKEASAITDLAPATLYKLAQQGRVRSFRVLNRALRFERVDMIALVKENV